MGLEVVGVQRRQLRESNVASGRSHLVLVLVLVLLGLVTREKQHLQQVVQELRLRPWHHLGFAFVCRSTALTNLPSNSQTLGALTAGHDRAGPLASSPSVGIGLWGRIAFPA